MDYVRRFDVLWQMCAGCDSWWVPIVPNHTRCAPIKRRILSYVRHPPRPSLAACTSYRRSSLLEVMGFFDGCNQAKSRNQSRERLLVGPDIHGSSSYPWLKRFLQKWKRSGIMLWNLIMIINQSRLSRVSFIFNNLLHFLLLVALPRSLLHLLSSFVL